MCQLGRYLSESLTGLYAEDVVISQLEIGMEKNVVPEME